MRFLEKQIRMSIQNGRIDSKNSLDPLSLTEQFFLYVHTSQTKVHFLVILESEEIQDSEIPEPRISHFQNLSQPCTKACVADQKKGCFRFSLVHGKSGRKLFDKPEVFPTTQI